MQLKKLKSFLLAAQFGFFMDKPRFCGVLMYKSQNDWAASRHDVFTTL